MYGLCLYLWARWGGEDHVSRVEIYVFLVPGILGNGAGRRFGGSGYDGISMPSPKGLDLPQTDLIITRTAETETGLISGFHGASAVAPMDVMIGIFASAREKRLSFSEIMPKQLCGNDLHRREEDLG